MLSIYVLVEKRIRYTQPESELIERLTDLFIIHRRHKLSHDIVFLQVLSTTLRVIF
jgi:hypothetical protein